MSLVEYPDADLMMMDLADTLSRPRRQREGGRAGLDVADVEWLVDRQVRERERVDERLPCLEP